MKVKKSILLAFGVFPLFFASAMANAVNSGAGKVTFNGSVIIAPCNIATESGDQTVGFGALSTAFLDAGNRSNNMPFDIELINCDATATTASVNFAGQTVSGAPDELATSGFTGTAIQVTNTGTPVKFGTPVPMGYLFVGNNTLQFGSHVKRATGVNATQVGDFTAVTNFTVIYP